MRLFKKNITIIYIGHFISLNFTKVKSFNNKFFGLHIFLKLSKSRIKSSN